MVVYRGYINHAALEHDIEYNQEGHQNDWTHEPGFQGRIEYQSERVAIFRGRLSAIRWSIIIIIVIIIITIIITMTTTINTSIYIYGNYIKIYRL